MPLSDRFIEQAVKMDRERSEKQAYLITFIMSKPPFDL